MTSAALPSSNVCIWAAAACCPARKRSTSRPNSSPVAAISSHAASSEAFLRPLGGYFRDRFDPMDPAPERLRDLAGLNAWGGAQIKDSAPHLRHKQVCNKLRGFILNDQPPLPQSKGRLHIP